MNIFEVSLEYFEKQYIERSMLLEDSEQLELMEEKFSIMYDLLQLALLENKPEVVFILLQHGIDLSKFLDSERLRTLYNNEAVSMNLFFNKLIPSIL